MDADLTERVVARIIEEVEWADDYEYMYKFHSDEVSCVRVEPFSEFEKDDLIIIPASNGYIFHSVGGYCLLVIRIDDEVALFEGYHDEVGEAFLAHMEDKPRILRPELVQPLPRGILFKD